MTRQTIIRLISTSSLAFVYHWLSRYRQWKRLTGEFSRWVQDGRPIPPPDSVKHYVLIEFARRYGLKVFVETGTFWGSTVAAMENQFHQIYSVELDNQLFAHAIERFRAVEHVKLIHGNSGEVLPQILGELAQPTLFWLDAHYSGGVTARGEIDTPIIKELSVILDAPDLGHVIIIDDAREFGRDPAYPTIDELQEFVLARRKGVQISVEGDSIRIVLVPESDRR